MVNLLVYPQKYNKRGDPSLHSVYGVDERGAPINIKLRMHEGATDHSEAPSIHEFSRNDRKAKYACVASDRNGPASREGVLIFRNCIYEGVRDGIPQWQSSWAHVIAEDADSPDPIIGFCRVDIKDKTNETINATRNYDRLKLSGQAASPEALSFLDDSKNPSNFHYPLLVYHFGQLCKMVSTNIIGVKKHIAGFVDAYTYAGFTGGVSLRSLNLADEFLESMEIFSRYNVSTRQYQSGLDVSDSPEVDKFLKRSAGNVQIIPIQRVNSGPICNRHYGDPRRYKYTREKFYSAQNSPIIYRCVAKVSYNKETKNTLLTRFYILEDVQVSYDQLPVTESVVSDDFEYPDPIMLDVPFPFCTHNDAFVVKSVRLEVSSDVNYEAISSGGDEDLLFLDFFGYSLEKAVADAFAIKFFNSINAAPEALNIEIEHDSVALSSFDLIETVAKSDSVVDDYDVAIAQLPMSEENETLKDEFDFLFDIPNVSSEPIANTPSNIVLSHDSSNSEEVLAGEIVNEDSIKMENINSALLDCVSGAEEIAPDEDLKIRSVDSKTKNKGFAAFFVQKNK